MEIYLLTGDGDVITRWGRGYAIDLTNSKRVRILLNTMSYETILFKFRNVTLIFFGNKICPEITRAISAYFSLFL